LSITQSNILHSQLHNTSTPWSGIGVKLEYVMCEHWFIESFHGNIEQNFNHMIRNTFRHIFKLVAIKQSLLMDVISKPESRFNHECLPCENAVLDIGEFDIALKCYSLFTRSTIPLKPGLWSRKSRHPTPTPGNFDYPTPTPARLRPSAVLVTYLK